MADALQRLVGTKPMRLVQQQDAVQLAERALGCARLWGHREPPGRQVQWVPGCAMRGQEAASARDRSANRYYETLALILGLAVVRGNVRQIAQQVVDALTTV